MKAMVTLTPEESKRLIGRSIARMEIVQRAMNGGIIGFSLCTSCGYVIQELLGETSVNLDGYCCGFIYAGGSCQVPPNKQERLLLLYKGEKRWLNFSQENFAAVLNEMDADDVIIKSGNVMDPDRNVGVLVSSPDGGEAGDYLPHILSKGIELIVPMTLNKTVPIRLAEIIPNMGIYKFRRDRVHGMSCGMMPLPGKVVTEIDAFRDLFGVKALPVAMNGIGSGAGSVTLILMGDDKVIEEAWQAVSKIKGEPPLKNLFSKCARCEGSSGKQGEVQCSTRLTKEELKR
jgi:hypothetical protein